METDPSNSPQSNILIFFTPHEDSTNSCTSKLRPVKVGPSRPGRDRRRHPSPNATTVVVGKDKATRAAGEKSFSKLRPAQSAPTVQTVNSQR